VTTRVIVLTEAFHKHRLRERRRKKGREWGKERGIQGSRGRRMDP
jgi:hypothetical protein